MKCSYQLSHPNKVDNYLRLNIVVVYFLSCVVFCHSNSTSLLGNVRPGHFQRQHYIVLEQTVMDWFVKQCFSCKMSRLLIYLFEVCWALLNAALVLDNRKVISQISFLLGILYWVQTLEEMVNIFQLCRRVYIISEESASSHSLFNYLFIS